MPKPSMPTHEQPGDLSAGLSLGEVILQHSHIARQVAKTGLFKSLAMIPADTINDITLRSERLIAFLDLLAVAAPHAEEFSTHTLEVVASFMSGQVEDLRELAMNCETVSLQ